MARQRTPRSAIVGNRQLPQTAHRYARRHRPERLPPSGSKRRERASTPESLRDEILALNIYNSVFVDCTASAEVASALPLRCFRPQRLGGGLQQDRRVVRLRPLPRAQNRLAQTRREIPLRDQRRRRSADHQHDLRPDKQRRPHPAASRRWFRGRSTTSSTA